MTVNNASPVAVFQGNGATTSFSFSMAVIDSDTIDVFYTDPAGVFRQLGPNEFTIILDPLVAPNPTHTGGTVIYNPGGVPIPSGSTLALLRNLDPVQGTSIANQSIIYPPVIEQALDYLTMLEQQGEFNEGRSIKVPVGDPLPADLPPKALRINQDAFWDADGNLSAGLPAAGSVMVSSAMQPVVAASTLEAARQAMGISVPTLVITSAFGIGQANNRQVLHLSGSAFYSVTVGAASGFSNTFWVVLFNHDDRGKTISVDGVPSFILWPSQWVWVFQDGTGGGWMVTNPGRWVTTQAQNFFVDYAAGDDNNDGLATGSQAFKTIQRAVDIVQTIADGPFNINLADGDHLVGTAGVLINKKLPGNTMVNLIGNIVNPSLCTITVTCSTLTANSQWGDGGALVARDGTVASVQGVTLRSSGTGIASGIKAQTAAVFYMKNCRFGAIGTSGNFSTHMIGIDGGIVVITGSYHIFGNCNWHAMTRFSGQVIYQEPGMTVTLDNNLPGIIGFNIAFQVGSIVYKFTVSFVNPGFLSAGYAGYSQYNSIISRSGSALPGALGYIADTGGLIF